MRILVFILSVYLIGLLSMAFGADIKDVSIDNVASPDLYQRRVAAEKIRHNRAIEINNLIDIASTTKDINWNGPKQMAIELLGEARDPAAIPLLLREFQFIPTGPTAEDEAQETHHYYISAMALAKIGMPSIEWLISEKMRKSPNVMDHELATWTIMEIEGRDQALARFQRMADAYKGDNNVHSLFDNAIKYIISYKPNFEPPSEKANG